MTPDMKTPGVYIVEKDAFPNSVVEVPTSVPAFVGFSEIHDGRPHVIESMAEFHDVFGHGPPDVYTLATDGPAPEPVRTSSRFHLYRSVLLFFRNGGGRCHIVSVGDYSAAPSAAPLLAGVQALEKEPEPALLVIPDAVLLDAADCLGVQRAALEHCGRTRRRMAILDLHRGWLPRADPDPVQDFRDGLVGADHLGFGAAYYPWLETTVVDAGSIGVGNLDAAGRGALQALGDEGGRAVVAAIQADLNRLPPGGAIAGLYVSVDHSRGVWAAPANASLTGVVRPTVEISHEEQEDLTVATTGLSVNAIRSFVGQGTLVWGARTLDGNSLNGRYVNVRRTLIMLEQSIRSAVKAYVFEANEAGTWITVKSMVIHFLTDIWKQGGLAGATSDEAFSVRVGLGETMTAADIEEGLLRMTVGLAVTRPAEFVVITIEQEMRRP